MKVIIVYSGKGGVGKTTTTANIAKALSEEGKKVFILDADVNTPSMPVIFPEKSVGHIQVASMGYHSKNAIYISNSAVRSYLSNCIKELNVFEPDYVLVDTPPSITDVHLQLLDKIKASGLVIVTQPNTLSTTDVNRTAMFFRENGVNIVGVIENMCTASDRGEYLWNVLGSIPFQKDFDFTKVYSDNLEEYKSIVKQLEGLDAIVLENKKRALFDESITFSDILDMPYKNRSDLKFVNLSTWDKVVDLLEDQELATGQHDYFLSECTTERIARMLKVFEGDEKGYFMVTRSPSCGIKLIPGEIGEGSLTVAPSYYGVPRIKYSTIQGEIVLFPYEIMPVSVDEITKRLQEGYIATKDNRYLPPKQTVMELEAAFGSRIGLFDGWEELYDNTLAGNLPRLDESPLLVEINEGKKRKARKERTVRDIAYELGKDR